MTRVRIAAAISGGGAKGAFQVGVLSQLRAMGISIDAFAGVSTGAIQAWAAAMDAVPELEQDWLCIRGNKDIHRRKLLPITSRYCTKPLRSRLERFARGKKVVKPLRVGVVSLQSGEFRLIEETAPELWKWVYASCMVPVEYEPVKVPRAIRDSTQWIDGGARNITPLWVADQFKPRGIIMIRAHPLPSVSYSGKSFDNKLKIGLRAVDVLQSEVSLNDFSNVGLRNDYGDTCERLHKLLDRADVPKDIAQQIRTELADLADRNGLVRVFAIAPAHEYSMTANYHQIDIAHAIAMGKQTVREREQDIRSFVEKCQ